MYVYIFHSTPPTQLLIMYLWRYDMEIEFDEYFIYISFVCVCAYNIYLTTN